MSQRALSFTWGTWALGDLPELISRAMDVVGPSASIVSAHVTPPADDQPLPEVHLDVPHQEEALRLRGEVDGCEFISHFDPEYDAKAWVCRVAGLRLRVTVKEDA